MKRGAARKPRAGVPRYRAVAQALGQAIANGEHAVGTTLPPEKTLCENFRVSRHTIREAIRLIESEGLVTRRQGSGTTVRRAQSDARYVQSMDSLDELLPYAAETRLDVQKADETAIEDAAERRLLGADAGERWLRIDGIRLIGGEADAKTALPIAAMTLYLPWRFRTLREAVGETHEAVYRLIEKRFATRIARVEQEIAAASIEGDLAERLFVDPGTPGLRITRRYLDANGAPLEVAVNLHPGGRFAYRMQLRREHA